MPKTVLRPRWQSTQLGQTVYVGDCAQVMRELPISSVDLVFADPPFNIGRVYDRYQDDLEEADYVQWTNRWCSALRHVLSPTGSVYVATGTKYQAHIYMALKGAGFHWRGTICWHYTFGPRQSKKWTPSWRAIHYFTTSNRHWKWNADPVKVPSARQLQYNDKRAKAGGKIPNDVWLLDPKAHELYFQGHQDTWLESIVCGTFKERTGHPCQMPEAIIHRILAASTDEGDLVLDPFLGSGTTAASCAKMRRRCVGIELSRDYVDDIAVPRLKLLEQGIDQEVGVTHGPQTGLQEAATAAVRRSVRVDRPAGPTRA